MGGRYGDDALVVAVSQPAVDGRATKAALKAVAEALDIAASEVTLVSGATSRTKVIEIPDESAGLITRLLGG